jgi:coenzyme F420-0:L-glutamate ligase / coenzyme F420-1:gamma-L-glutamate ligase
MSAELRAIPVTGVPEIFAGDQLGRLLAERTTGQLQSGDVIVVSQKVVSKREGRIASLGSITPGEEAARLAAELGKDPRLVELILRESAAVIRAEHGILIVRTNSGLVCANAGIDSSNAAGGDAVVLLPIDPDESARRLRAELHEASGLSPAVVVADSFGRAWRIGQVEVAIGCAGLIALDDWRGRVDRDGRELTATQIAIADEAAAAADLVRGKDEGVPAVVVRGLERYVTAANGPGAAVLRRAEADDLFG